MKLTSIFESKHRKRLIDFSLSLIVAGVFVGGFYQTQAVLNDTSQHNQSKIVEEPLLNSEMKFGFAVDTVHFEPHQIKKNQILGDILQSNGITHQVIKLIEEKAKDIFSPKHIQSGKNYHVIRKNECDETPLAIVYEHDKTKYVLYDFRDQPEVKLIEREVKVVEEFAHGTIESSLWKALEKKGINPAVIDFMEEALSTSVDFYHTKKGDEFKLIYENKYVDNESVGMGKLIAAYYKNAHGEYYSMRYKTKDKEGFFDSEGRPARKNFLKAPVKFSRISSGYNLRRFHPVRGKRMPHLGTDYAAPTGTPIRAVADGVVTASSYTGNNGNFVKIKHDKVYETQYLHMSRFAKGVKVGSRVTQGQTIGYVGSTGLATGPHVCFRFWKNGVQVNHLTEKLPSAEPMNVTELPEFFKYRDEMIVKLANINNLLDTENNVPEKSLIIKP